MKQFFFCFLLLPLILFAKPPTLTPKTTLAKLDEIMHSHVTHKTLSPEIIQRALTNFVEELDPTKTYFIESDIDQWIHPTPALLAQVEEHVKQANFSDFQGIFQTMQRAIVRRDSLEKEVASAVLPEKVDLKKFKDLPWATNEQELLTRILEVKSIQMDASKKLHDDLQERSMQRIAKAREQYESEIQSGQQELMLSKVLKAFANALDTHTEYFTPEEAKQFLINVQQRLFGIGAALRDDIKGFRVIKIVEGGPADRSGELKLNDLVIAVNGEPVVGMNINDAVQLIRGEENTPVNLTVLREVPNDPEKREETLDVSLMRGEVVIKESRYEVSYEPFGDGVIAHLRLFSFYQDPEHSSAGDLAAEFEKLKKEHKILGVLLDLRNNSGGLLVQAVEVTGLFITKGVVVSIKDENGSVQHLRETDDTSMWNGPLVVLINRLSASASEIVAETLQDYGRAVVVGDDHSFGKGSFQTFTLNADGKGTVNPQGEYKVTRGRYYTVSGKSPQLTGVVSDIVIPGPLSEAEVGEKFAKYPLGTDEIPPSFNDKLEDVPYVQRAKLAALYNFNLQPKLSQYTALLSTLKKNEEFRIKNNKNYQAMLEELKKKKNTIVDEDESVSFGQNDLQLFEAYNVLKDLIILQWAPKEKATEESPQEDLRKIPALS